MMKHLRCCVVILLVFVSKVNARPVLLRRTKVSSPTCVREAITFSRCIMLLQHRPLSYFPYSCMYVCMVITYSKGKDQPGKVANLTRGQLNRENEHFPVPVRA